MTVVNFGGCAYPYDADDPIEQAVRDARAAENRIVRPARSTPWLLVGHRVVAGTREGGQTGRPRPAGGTSFECARCAPSGEARSSILLRPGQSGFVAVARDAAVREFALGKETYGGDGRKTDRGFDITISLEDDGFIVRMTPVFRRLGPDEADVRAESETFEAAIGPGEALAVGSSLVRPGSVALALLAGPGEPAPSRLCIEVEAVE